MRGGGYMRGEGKMMRKYVNNGNKLSCLDLNVAFQTLFFR